MESGSSDSTASITPAQVNAYLSDIFDCHCLIAYNLSGDNVVLVRTLSDKDVRAIQQLMEDTLDSHFKQIQTVQAVMVEEDDDDLEEVEF